MAACHAYPRGQCRGPARACDTLPTDVDRRGQVGGVPGSDCMGDAALNFLFLLISLSLAIIGAIVGAWLQHRSWMNQHWEKVREERTKAALLAVEDAAKLIDRRLYRQRRFLWAARRGPSPELTAARQDYQEVIFEWMDNLGRLKAELWLSFDRWTAVRFEGDVHDEFASVGRRIERAVRGGRPTPLGQEERQLDALGRSSYEFIHELLRRVATEDIRGLSGRDQVSFENWNNLSTGFLLRRLFGLPA